MAAVFDVLTYTLGLAALEAFTALLKPPAFSVFENAAVDELET